MSRRAVTILLYVIIAVVLGLAVAFGQAPTPQPTPFTITDENVRQIPLEQIVATLKHARQLAADAIERADKQSATLASALGATMDTMAAAKTALERLDRHDQEVRQLAAENERNKEESLKKDATIVKKNFTIFKLQAALAAIMTLIVLYVGLKLFTKLPIP